MEPTTCEVPGRCEGAVARRCDTLPNGMTIEWAVDCAANTEGNTQCLFDPADAGSTPVCGVGLCDDSLDETSCGDNTIIRCVEGREAHYDCTALGQSCVAPPSNGVAAFCASDAACDANHCDGHFLVTCGNGRELSRLDCGTRAPLGTCETIEGQPTCAASMKSSDCADVPYKSWCGGDLAVACVLGARITTSCAAFKNARCVEDEADGIGRCEL